MERCFDHSIRRGQARQEGAWHCGAQPRKRDLQSTLARGTTHALCRRLLYAGGQPDVATKTCAQGPRNTATRARYPNGSMPSATHPTRARRGQAQPQARLLADGAQSDPAATTDTRQSQPELNRGANPGPCPIPHMTKKRGVVHLAPGRTSSNEAGRQDGRLALRCKRHCLGMCAAIRRNNTACSIMRRARHDA